MQINESEHRHLLAAATDLLKSRSRDLGLGIHVKLKDLTLQLAGRQMPN